MPAKTATLPKRGPARAQATRAAVPCPLCHEDPACARIVDTVWDAPDSAVYRCSSCTVVFVWPIMSPEEQDRFYGSEFSHYMKRRGGPGETKPEDQFRANAEEAARRLALLRPMLRRKMDVLEVGSSTGFLLDAIRPHVGSVTGVEPGDDYRAFANGRKLRTVARLDDVAAERFDLILGYYVVEHLRDPVEFLQRLRGLLRTGGRIAVEVPNVDDALVSYYRLPAFNRFYWQKAHFFNYSRKTLPWVLERAGYRDVEAHPEQRYDISNHLHWLLKGEPGGKGRYTDVLDDAANREYQRCLKEHWICDTVFATATNPKGPK